MERLDRCKYLLFAICALSALVYADLLTYGQFRISIITIFFGFVPVLFLTAKRFVKSKDKTHP
jgi:hypothetical protein